MKTRLISLTAMLALLAISALGTQERQGSEDRQKELERIKAASAVLNEIQGAPDKGIPEEIMASADCVAIVPSMLKGGFVFGGRYGKGVATCRHGNQWSAPAPIRIEGGSWGLQIGGQAVDLVMLVMNKKGMDQLLSSKFKVGADVSAAAGPVGRHAEANTDWKMRAEVLTYSRARGAFAGITLNGAVIKQDQDDTVALYGRMIPFSTILSGSVPAPSGTQNFLAEVSRYFRSAKAGEVARNPESTPEKTSGATEGRETRTMGGAAGTSAGAQTEQSSGGSAAAVGSQTGAATSGRQSGVTTEQTPTTASGQPAAGSSSRLSSDEIKQNIDKALQQSSGVSAANVSVKVGDDSVQLFGTVPSADDKQAVRQVAEQNANGRKVDDSGVVVK